MRKIYVSSFLTLALVATLVSTSNAQSQNTNSEVAPISSVAATSIPTNSTDALFDIQFAFFAEDSVPTISIAGVGFTGTELWLSRWTGNVIYHFTPTGSFVDSFSVTGVAAATGIRSMTFDGTNMWVSYNATTIKKIDPVTKAVLATVTPPALTGGSGLNTTIRWITYDPTLNSGAGGFWTGNYDTDILQISMTGTLLSTIPATTHGLTAMYGAAYDNLSPGGPYVWANNQVDPATATVAGSVIVQLDPSTGAQTGVIHDQNVDFGSTTGVAGGITVTQLPGLPNSSIISVDQGVATTMYELAVAQGIHKVDLANSFGLQPNPSNGLFTIVNKTKSADADVIITNASGKTVYTKHFNNLVNEKVDARNLSKGVYTVTVVSEMGKTTKSMIVQ